MVANDFLEGAVLARELGHLACLVGDGVLELGDALELRCWTKGRAGGTGGEEESGFAPLSPSTPCAPHSEEDDRRGHLPVRRAIGRKGEGGSHNGNNSDTWRSVAGKGKGEGGG